MQSLVLNILIFSLCIIFVNGLSCLYTPYQCRNETIQQKVCSHAPTECPRNAIIKDPCGCCNECAKFLHEECGGPYNVLGRCDETLGLQCNNQMFQAGNCECKKVPVPLDCPYGVEETEAGCLTGNCKNPPRCEVIGFRRRKKTTRCEPVPTVFCTYSCESCCQHYSTCAPNSYQRQDESKCKTDFLGDEATVEHYLD